MFLPATVLHLQPHQTNYTSLSCFIGFLSTINIDYDFEGATNMSVFFLTGDELEDYRSKITLDVNYFPLQTVFSITGVALDKHLKGFHRVFAFIDGEISM
ncbi:hypothetical protein C9374_013560 [Naegleria lovaniensis]|uniref:Uncharacterized protein n=1 Tax=Naegleria lovaniensis TaxID=51637 RepID=A0AA88GW80_NAELO|nr:uncharacterized protein C9374_013560 [Naegleria lovaniensis]KAG2392075.1 hypothetical protein C9374_013560 [Naegleria lovaniensis]